MKEIQIFIVEDERIVAEDIRIRLEKLGFVVSGIAHSGQEALRITKETKPDLVLMDIVLEGEMDGIETASAIRSQLDIPVIYLTAYSDKMMLDRAKITEPFGYIIKPFEDRELHSTIEIALYKHRMEKKLKESELWLFTILRSIGDAVIATDTQENITFMNPVAQALTGWDQKEAEGKLLGDIFRVLNEQTGYPVKVPVDRLFGEGGIVGPLNQTILVTRNGARIPIDAAGSPIKYENGRIGGAVLVFKDMTERKKTMDELRKAYKDLTETQQELVQSEKLAALGRFSSGIAHEIKNPLGVILGGLEFLERKLKRGGRDVKTAIEKIKESTFRANDVVQGLLKFARPSELKAERVNPNELVKEVLSFLKYKMPSNLIKIITDFSKEELSVKVDKNQMEQVFFNLMINAVEAMSKGGLITVKTSKMIKSEFSVDEPFCIVEVIDNGEGISKEDLEKIFEPFFTTKRDKKGTGLGLSMAKMIVNNHRGELQVESKQGKGTTAKVILPLASKEVKDNGKKNPYHR